MRRQEVNATGPPFKAGRRRPDQERCQSITKAELKQGEGYLVLLLTQALSRETGSLDLQFPALVA
jgi:hypothetical protein